MTASPFQPNGSIHPAKLLLRPLRPIPFDLPWLRMYVVFYGLPPFGTKTNAWVMSCNRTNSYRIREFLPRNDPLPRSYPDGDPPERRSARPCLLVRPGRPGRNRKTAATGPARRSLATPEENRTASRGGPGFPAGEKGPSRVSGGRTGRSGTSYRRCRSSRALGLVNSRQSPVLYRRPVRQPCRISSGRQSDRIFILPQILPPEASADGHTGAGRARDHMPATALSPRAAR